STDDVTAELPRLALTFTRKFLPMIIGSASGWLRLTGITARPAATSDRTNSALTPSRTATNSISRVMTPSRAHASWVRCSDDQPRRSGYSPLWTLISTSGSVYGPEVSYTSKWSPFDSAILRIGTESPDSVATYVFVEPSMGPVVTWSDTGVCNAVHSLRWHYPVRFVRSATPGDSQSPSQPAKARAPAFDVVV